MIVEPSSNANNKKWSVLIRWLGTLLSIGIMGWLLYKTGWQQVWEQARQLAWWRLVACVVLVFISRLATWGRWHTLMQVQDVKVRWQDSLRLTFAGLFASNVLPTTIGGDVARLAGAVRIGVEPAMAAASLMADRLVGLTGMALMLPFAVPALLEKTRNGKAAEGLFWALALIPDHGLWGKLKRGIAKVLTSFKYWLMHPDILLKALGFTFIHMACIYGIVTLLIEGMGESMPLHLIAGIWSLTYFISLLPVSINGLGLQEVTITNLFAVLGGLQATTTLSLAVILRAIWMIGSLPGAFFLSSIIAGKRNGIEEKNLEVNEP